jgi:hypothetical protein
MDPLVKRLLIIGIFGLIVTWGTFLILELAPEDEEPETIAPQPEIEHGSGVSSNKKRERERASRIAAARRRRSEKKPSTVQPPTVRRSVPPRAPQQTAAIKSPKIPDIPPQLSTAVKPTNPTQVRFNQMEKVFETEIRDSVWADEKEKRVLDIFKKGDYEQALVDISCRKTLCRIEIRMSTPDTLLRLYQLSGLAEELGPNAATQPLSEGDEKRMVSFIKRKD